MAWGFRKSKKLMRGVRLNVSKGGVGMSLGRRGATVSGNTRGQKGVSLGWRGMFWRKRG